MSRDYIDASDAPADMAWSLRSIADSLAKLADAPPRWLVIQIPATFSVEDAKEFVERLQDELGVGR